MPIAAEINYQIVDGSEDPARLPLVLVHGAGGNFLYWPGEIRRLPGFQVYALDLPGHGKTTRPGEQSIPAYARVLSEWMDAVSIQKAIVIGHSMGSAITLQMALDYPQRIAGIGLVAGGARLRVAPIFIEKTSSPTTFNSAVESIIEASFGPDADPRMVELAAARMAETRYSVLNGDFLACEGFDEIQRLGQVQVPALVLCGSEDRMTPVRFSQYLADNLPDARLVVLPGAGHMVMLEKPLEVASAIQAFAQELVHTGNGSLS